MAAVLAYYDQVTQLGDLLFFALSAVFITTGVLAIIVWGRRSRDPLLLWFGVVTLLYGVRLMADNRAFRTAVGMSGHTVDPVIGVVTSVILIPCVLFVRELFGAFWQRINNTWLWVQIAFAPASIIFGIAGGRQSFFWTINHFLAIAGSLYLVAVLFFGPPRSSKVLKISLTVFLVFVIANNLGFAPGGWDVEPFGFAVLLFGLGYTAVDQTIVREQKLIAVEQELSTARRIQQSILPQILPAIPGLVLDARYEPMTAVAGDFYGFLPVGDRALTILVADVSGHGVPAALIASMLKVAFEAQADHAHDPALVLTGMNAVLSGAFDGHFVTAAVAHVDLGAGKVTYAGAGHPPVLLARASGEVVELQENGLMLGPFPAATYSNTSAPFGPGDRLVLYTDGFPEATMPDGEPFGLERMKAVVRAGLGSLPDRLIAAVSGAVREDDLTVVVAQRA